MLQDKVEDSSHPFSQKSLHLRSDKGNASSSQMCFSQPPNPGRKRKYSLHTTLQAVNISCAKKKRGSILNIALSRTRILGFTHSNGQRWQKEKLKKNQNAPESVQRAKRRSRSIASVPKESRLCPLALLKKRLHS